MEIKKSFTKGKANKVVDLAAEIYDYFNDSTLSIPRIAKMVKTHGEIAIRELFEETKKSSARCPVALFLWKVKQNRMVWSYPQPSLDVVK